MLSLVAPSLIYCISAYTNTVLITGKNLFKPELLQVLGDTTWGQQRLMCMSSKAFIVMTFCTNLKLF